MAYRNMEKALEQFNADAVTGHVWGLNWEEFEILANMGGHKTITSAYNYGFLRGMRYEKTQAKRKAQGSGKTAHVHYMTLARALAATDTAVIEQLHPAIETLRRLWKRQTEGEQITTGEVDGVLLSLEEFNESLLKIFVDNGAVSSACVIGSIDTKT